MKLDTNKFKLPIKVIKHKILTFPNSYPIVFVFCFLFSLLEI